MLNEKNRFYGTTKKIEIDILKKVFNSAKFDYIDIAILFGSCAVGDFM